MRLGKAQEIVNTADERLIALLESPIKIHDPERAHVELDTILLEMIRGLAEHDGSTAFSRVASRADEVISKVRDEGW